jgi:hypothetical protein
MNASRGMYIRNTAHVILNLEYIRIADINELSEIAFIMIVTEE